MDSPSQNSIDAERKVFLAKLKTNPIFLIRHIGSLSGAVWHRLRKRHAAKKIWPTWLQDLNLTDNNSPSELFTRIPVHQLKNPTVFVDEKLNAHAINNMYDHEDYLKAHRFGELISQLVAGSLSLPPTIEYCLHNPPLKNDPAWETYSTCERVCNLLTWLSFLPVEKRSITCSHEITAMLVDSMQWIASHIEFYGKRTNNHILNNARALVMCGVVLNNENAIQMGLRIFENMLPILIQTNGSLRERSSHYQLIVLTWLLDAYVFLDSRDSVFLQDYILRMRNAASLLCDAEGYLQAYIGDISPDATPRLTCERLKHCYPQYWPTQSAERSLDDWHILRNGANKIILNCPEGRYPKKYPAHSHTDITSFVWLHGNKPILIDAGRARYTKEPIAILQKSALGHNVPLVNDFAPLCESLVINGNWWPAPYAKAQLKMQHAGANTIKISHNGFRRTTPVRKHHREITLNNDNVEIQDHFEGSGQVLVNVLWQMHPSFKNFNKKTLTLSNNEMEVGIILNPKMIYLPDIEMGWCSTEYGYAQANFVLIIKYMITLPFTSHVTFKVQKCVA